ncbi:MAG TPA: hypothetical protein VG754_01840, partial [Verrucomicrobiae bacterium]|nr:hypothetical protein [Verrucomicrobiae bacterium]
MLTRGDVFFKILAKLTKIKSYYSRQPRIHFACIANLLIFAVGVTGCIPTTRHEPPQTAGKRTNSQGKVVQRIIREVTRTYHPVLLTPEGPKTRVESRCKFFFQEGETPRRAFLIGNSATNQFFGDCLAVKDSALWVTFWCEPMLIFTTNADLTVDDRKRDDLHVLIFDEKGFMRHRIFTTTSKQGWDEDYTDSAKAQ